MTAVNTANLTFPLPRSEHQATGNSLSRFQSVQQLDYKPLHEIESRKEIKEEIKERSLKTSIWHASVLGAPILCVVGGLLWVATSIPAATKLKILAPLSKAVKKDISVESAEKFLENKGKYSLALGELFTSLTCISGGIVSSQPGMMLCGLLKIIPAGMLVRAKSDAVRNLAASLDMFLGGMFTVGLANEFINNDPKTPDKNIRRYDMTHFKSLFSSQSRIPFPSRIGGVFKELGSMIAFNVKDHVLLAKGLGKTIWKGLSKLENRYQPVNGSAKPPRRRTFKEWASDPSAEKSQVAAIMFYLSTLPILLLTRKNPKIGEKKSVVIAKMLTFAICNLPQLAVALNREDVKGKAPLLGVPLQVVGLGNSVNKFFIGIGQLGKASQELFYSDVAVHGVETHSERKSKAPGDPAHVVRFSSLS